MTGKLSARLTLSACEQIQSRMLEACREVAADYGLVIESAGWRDMTSGLSFEPVFRVSVRASDGKAFDLERERFEFLAEQYGLSAADFGREFSTGRERFRIVGIDPQAASLPGFCRTNTGSQGLQVYRRERSSASAGPGSQTLILSGSAGSCYQPSPSRLASVFGAWSRKARRSRCRSSAGSILWIRTRMAGQPR
jgi:hypothetical protein